MMIVRDRTHNENGNFDNAKILKALTNDNMIFTVKQLEQIIHDEFFCDDNPLDTQVVDAALTRIMHLDKEEVTGESLQAKREKMMRRVFAEILGIVYK